MKLWALFAIGLLGCSSDTTNEPQTDCTPGATQVCNCSAADEGVQVCRADKTFGACDCGGGAGGSGGGAGASSGGTGGDLCGGTCTRLQVCSDGTDGHEEGTCWGCERDPLSDEPCQLVPPGNLLAYSNCPEPMPGGCLDHTDDIKCCD